MPDTYLDLSIALSDHMKLDDRYTLLVRDSGG